mmetsp:Transcript_36995/g.81028  ORF Transcript_36995/g.81028 Transcript_36995/m.81028 type:complete len:903 (-) Transcript_36995:1020-3728(-)
MVMGGGSINGHARRPPLGKSSSRFLPINDDENKEQIPRDIEQTKQKQQEQDKSDEILRCLSGTRLGDSTSDCNVEEVVDLWHLRSLALQPGGLLNSSIRRRAWPKLLGVDAHVLGGGAASAASVHEITEHGRQDKKIRLSSTTIAEIKRDVGRTAWDVEGTIKLIRKEREAERRAGVMKKVSFKNSSDKKNNTIKSVDGNVPSFASVFVPNIDTASTSIVGTVSPAMSPMLPAYPSSSSDSGSSVASLSSTVTSSPGRLPISYHGTNEPIVAYSTFDGMGSPFPNLSEVARKKSARMEIRTVATPKMSVRTKQEQDILLNILTTVLRTPPSNASGEDGSCATEAGEGGERLHYTSGLHSLASLLLINLESPSLTSLTMQRLSTHHLRDVMRSTLTELSATVRIAFLPLLERVDPHLHSHLVDGGITSDVPFATGWIVSWFAHEGGTGTGNDTGGRNGLLNLDVASRLVDVFLCSHPLMPVYVSVVMLAHPTNRERIMEAQCDTDALTQVLCRVPSDMGQLVAGGNGGDDFFGNDMDWTSKAEMEKKSRMLMVVFEEIIDGAIGLMRRLPPTELLSSAHGYSEGALSDFVPIASSATCMLTPPSWAVAPTASTDWSLIQQAKAAREAAQLSPMSEASTPTSSPTTSTKKFFFGSSSEQVKDVSVLTSPSPSHQIALDAAGLGGSTSTSDSSISVRLWKTTAFLLAVAAAASVGSIGEIMTTDQAATHAQPHSSPIPITRSAVWNGVSGKFESTASTSTRNGPRISPIPIKRSAVWNDVLGRFESTTNSSTGTGRGSFVVPSTVSQKALNAIALTENFFVRGISFVESSGPRDVFTAPSREVLNAIAQTENFFVRGESFVGTSVEYISKPTIDAVARGDIDVKAGRLDRLANTISASLPWHYYY